MGKTIGIYFALAAFVTFFTSNGIQAAEQAGGMVLKTDGNPLLYNTKDNILNPNFVVINSAKFKELFVKND